MIHLMLIIYIKQTINNSSKLDKQLSYNKNN